MRLIQYRWFRVTFSSFAGVSIAVYADLGVFIGMGIACVLVITLYTLAKSGVGR